jgi:hypothetical protein
MKLILLAFLLVMVAVVSVVVARRRREQARAERAQALRYERWKARRGAFQMCQPISAAPPALSRPTINDAAWG